ncbi:MAG: tRNA dihydrouridine synthase DusB [Lautropia sp.]|nr:tRNA dihydrouridine synthase DusB [Lautropia sp.]
MLQTRALLQTRTLKIGPYTLPSRTLVAPMAGVTDRPFRQLCKRLGAGYAVSEMAASDPRLRDSVKTSRRIDHDGEIEPKAVQIAGADPAMMADAARFNVGRGAQIIDINMGCPARKVCNVAAGSALMADESLALRIIEAVVNAVDVPVTVKMRTGTDSRNRNAVRIARGAEQAGTAMITVHGRTRACQYHGAVDYDTIAEVKSRVTLPVIANGDIDSPEKARQILDATGADGIMIGRAAQGRPWIFREIDHYLATGGKLAGPTWHEIWSLLRQHLLDHYAFYGEFTGVRTARKHIGWYLRGMQQEGLLQGCLLGDMETLRGRINDCEAPEAQLDLIERFFSDRERVLDTCTENWRDPCND